VPRPPILRARGIGSVLAREGFPTWSARRRLATSRGGKGRGGARREESDESERNRAVAETS